MRSIIPFVIQRIIFPLSFPGNQSTRSFKKLCVVIGLFRVCYIIYARFLRLWYFGANLLNNFLVVSMRFCVVSMNFFAHLKDLWERLIFLLPTWMKKRLVIVVQEFSLCLFFFFLQYGKQPQTDFSTTIFGAQ